MIRSISIFLLSLTFLDGAIDLHNLVKVPGLIEHYQEHCKRLPGFSFFGFIALHYGNKAGTHDQEEHGKHQKLPFKSSGSFSDTLSVVSTFKTCERKPTAFLVTCSNFYQSNFYSGFSKSIWQPPRN